MCTMPITRRFPATVSDRLRGNFTDSEVTIPCGKCCECMNKKRNSIRFRVYNEAKKRGTMDFLTLTYNNDMLPIATTLWSIDRSSGEMSQYGDFIIQKNVPSDIRAAIVGDYESERKNRMKSYLQRHEFSDYDSEKDYYLSYSPAHDYEQVKRLLKYCRTYFHRKYGIVSDFSYICVPEFGEHNSRRPHFHMCLFGAPDEFVRLFMSIWSNGFYVCKKAVESSPLLGLKRGDSLSEEFYHSYLTLLPSPSGRFKDIPKSDYYFRCITPAIGFIDRRRVMSVNEDGSDGFAKVASYVGKYVGKGVFEDALIKDGFVVLPRISISKHFGQLPQCLVDWHLCKDLYGDYDDESLSGLSESQISKIVESVAGRLYHDFGANKDEKIVHYALPIQFYNQVFRRRTALSRNDLPSYLKKAAFDFYDWPPSGKTVYSLLFYKVKDFVRNRTLQDLEKEFRAFISNNASKGLCEAVAAFELRKSRALQARAEIAYQRQLKSLQKLIF